MIPDDLYTPINIKTNPGGLSWAEIKNKYNISEVEFINGEPVFNEVSKGNVCITNFTSGGISVLKAGD